MTRFVILLLAFCLSCEGSNKKILESLNSKIVSYVAREEVANYTPPLGWQKIKGLYESWIHLYTHGDVLQTVLRRVVKAYDNNGFATMWTATQLVEAATHGGFAGIHPKQILENMRALHRFRDRNRPPGSGVLTFWSQKVFNKTSGLWMCEAENMHGAINYALETIPWKQIEWLLGKVGLVRYIKTLERVKKQIALYGHTTHLPGDFDDSSVMLGLGLLLQRSPFTKAAEEWLRNNTNATYLMKMYKKYAYRPLGTDNETNVIDPKSYFYTRPLIEEAMKSGQQVAWVSTWTQTLRENLEQRPSISTPMNMNTVDCTVGANAIYAILSGLLAPLQNPSVWFDQDLKTIFVNTTELVSWAVRKKLIDERPDITLTYYPSQFLFHWFLSRSVFLIQSEGSASKIPEIGIVRGKLLEARAAATSWLLSQAEIVGDYVFWDDFLGNADSWFGKPVKYGEARLATTGLVLNTLLNYWTEYRPKQRTLSWSPDVPKSVQQTISSAVKWLKKHILAGDLETMNLFFSGAIRGNSSDPRFYPINFFFYMNGTEAHGNKTGSLNSMALGWRGAVSPDKYEQWIREWEQKTGVPIDSFPGYNQGERNWRFWTSPAFTYSNALLAFSKYANIPSTRAPIKKKKLYVVHDPFFHMKFSEREGDW